MSETHFEISKKQMFSWVIGLLIVLAGICVWVYQRETDATFRSIQTNQQVIQSNTDKIQKTTTHVAVVEERVKGHKEDKKVHNE